MTDYILRGWGNKVLWILNNATWLNNDLQIGDGDSGGYAEREFTDILNKNWELKIYNSAKRYEGDPLGTDKQIFLKEDSNPIIFRRQYNIAAESRTFYIIYDSVIRDQITIEGGVYWPSIDMYYLDRIWRIGSVYYYQGIVDEFELSFDYSSEKKPVKLKFTTHGETKTSKWHNLDWYYTEPTELGDFAFVT